MPHLLTLLVLSVLTPIFAADARADPGRPNVVFILIDDISDFGIGAYGAESVYSTQGYFEDTPVRTPHIDRLAQNGLRCDQAYVYPICEPTRVALMTGMHNGRNYIQTKALHESQITFGDVFQKAGYKTGLFGKWKQTRGTPQDPGEEYIFKFGWDEFFCFDVTNGARGWNRHIDPVIFDNGREIVYHKQSPVDPNTQRRWYGPDLCNQAARDFLKRQNPEQPFFLYYSMLLVHDEHTPTPDTEPAAAYDQFDTKGDTGFGHMKGDDRRYFPDMLDYTDKLIGNLLEELDLQGLSDNTIIVVMGDNGAKACFGFNLADGSQRVGGKGHNHDKGEHVPLIFSWPGHIPVGTPRQMRAYDGVFDVTDIYPTLLAACGIELPNPGKIDGVNAWPQIIGQDDRVHRQAIYKWANGNRPIRDDAKAVSFAHTAEFKRYAPSADFPKGRFFDLRDDLDEEAGEPKVKAGWENFYHTGLDPATLTSEQRAAYNMLGEVLERNRYVAVDALRIQADATTLNVGGKTKLSCEIIPTEATRNNIIWESSDPGVAVVDKFGVLSAVAPGAVKVTVYSWDDAEPAADNRGPAYRRDGVNHAVTFTVKP